MEAIFKGENILEFIKVVFNQIAHKNRFFTKYGIPEIREGDVG